MSLAEKEMRALGGLVQLERIDVEKLPAWARNAISIDAGALKRLARLSVTGERVLMSAADCRALAARAHAMAVELELEEGG